MAEGRISIAIAFSGDGGEGRCVRAAALLVIAACGSHAPARSPAPASPAPPAAHPELTADVVLAKVQGGYANGVQRCYTRYLKNRSGHGRVLVLFTVDAEGRAQDGTADGVPQALGACITAEVARWRFPRPQNGEQRFAVPLDLVIE